MTLCVFTICGSSTILYAQQPLETETARPLKAGAVEVHTAFEYQTSKEGKEYALPFAFEYGITDRLSLLVEPVFFTGIHPKTGSRANDIGDLEATLSYLVLQERKFLPALMIAGEIKAPTARNILIGTGKPDYTAYIFASKRYGRFETHANVGYTIVGQTSGAELKNVYNFALAEEFHMNKKFDLLGEVLVNTSSLNGASTDSSEPTVMPETAGKEVVGTVGFRYYVRSKMAFSLGVSYDNNHALLFRPGFSFYFNSLSHRR
jgi:hypothetical protein